MPQIPFKVQVAVFAGCLGLAAACYVTSLPNDFIMDDIHVVAQNERIRSVAPIGLLVTPYWDQRIQDGLYRPLPLLTFSLEYAAWGRWAAGFRATNIVLHALNGFLVFLLAAEFLGTMGAAGAAAAVYVAHPVFTEAVVFIIGRNELLAATFLFSAWLLFRRGRTGLSALAFAFSALSKENAIIFPAIVALDLWLQGGARLEAVIREWRRLLVLGATALAYLALRFWVIGSIGVPASGQYLGGQWSLMERWMTSGRAFLEYFRLVFAPVVVGGDYGPMSIPLAGIRDLDAWAGLSLVALTVGVGLLLRRRNRALSLGVLFFYTALLPVSNLIVPIGSVLAERFLYTPLFGVALLAGYAFSAISNSNVRNLVAAGAIVCAIGLCNSHNFIWRDEASYFSNLVRVTPGNVKARFNYGTVLLRQRRWEEAEQEFEAGLRLAPTTAVLLSGLAAVKLARDQNCVEAYPLLERAQQIDPRDAYSSWLIGDCFLASGRLSDAELAYRRALEHGPSPEPRLLLAWGTALEALGRQKEADAAFARATAIDPVFMKQREVGAAPK